MKTEKGNKILSELVAKIEKDFDIKLITTKLKEVRAVALEEEDPLLVRVSRQIYEYLAENEAFDYTVEKEYSEDDEGEEVEEVKAPGTDTENLVYLLNLIKGSENKFNREEIKEMRTWLKENA
mgnify:CR=1 FL=1|tara:strand:+ start:2977 stop:3345 length:369 start_codon:yes stop_codon:yes gene_type:complete